MRGRWRFLSRFVTGDSCFRELGGGDCALAAHVAERVRKVVVVEVSEVITALAAPNLDVVISDGTSVPVEQQSVDVAFSDQLMEHLHPDDARTQLANIVKALRPGGTYVCITPNRLTGPHDVSSGFDDVATGLHLREYSARELSALFLDAGFSRVDFYAGGRGRYVRLPPGSPSVAEAAFARLPTAVRQRVRGSTPALALLGLNAVAQR